MGKVRGVFPVRWALKKRHKLFPIPNVIMSVCTFLISRYTLIENILC